MKDNRNTYKDDNQAQSITKAANSKQSEIKGLVASAASGSFEAFGKLYHIYAEQIYRYVFYQVKNKMLAEDITADVFLRALKAINSCRGKEATFSSWLYRIAHNCVIDNFRSTKRTMPIETEILTGSGDPGQELEKKVERQEILEVIAYLPKNQRQVIILKFIDELDNCEIGQIMGKSEGAIRILQMRALGMLREKLGISSRK